MRHDSKNVQSLYDEAALFLSRHPERSLFALDYRDDGVYFGKSDGGRLLFHDGKESDWSRTSMLRIFDSENEFYALQIAQDEYIVRIIENESEESLEKRKLHELTDEELFRLNEGLFVLDERHVLWGSYADGETAGGWIRYTEARGNSVMLPVRLDLNKCKVYAKVRNYIEAKNGNVHVIDARLCGICYLDNGIEREVV